MIKLITTITAAAAAFSLAACDVDKTQEGEMPEVDIDAKGGQLPKYDVDAPDVDVTTEEKTITVPVPDVDVTPPADDGEDGVLGTADDNAIDQ